MAEIPLHSPTAIAPDVRQIIDPLVQHFSVTERSPEALLYPNARDVPHRFDAMFSGLDWDEYSRERPLRLLDVGCGTGYLIDYLHCRALDDRVDYVGIDLAGPILDAARQRWPDHHFEQRDIRSNPFPPDRFDHAVLCGIFTARFGLDRDSMERLVEDTLAATWPSVTRSLAFNAMSIHVDWERDDLFHLPMDDAVRICAERLGSRQVRLLHDYGLYEFTLVVARDPVRRPDLAEDWCSRRPGD